MNNDDRDRAITDMQATLEGIKTELSNMNITLSDVKKHLFEPEHSLIVRVKTLETHHNTCMDRMKEEKEAQQNQTTNKYSLFQTVIAVLVLFLSVLTVYREFKPLIDKPPAVKKR
jgi:hypothetical protein